MFYRYPINDVHIHLFDPKDIDECIAMVDECGYTNWTFLACTVIDSPFALAQNLLCALMKLKEGGRARRSVPSTTMGTWCRTRMTCCGRSSGSTKRASTVSRC